MKTEYPIWGVPKGETTETLLYTKAKSYAEAKLLCEVFETKYGATKTRIQILEFNNNKMDFITTINI